MKVGLLHEGSEKLNRRMMMEQREFRIEYDISSSAGYSYIRLGGEGEEIRGSGEIRVRKGEFLLIYAYSRLGSSVSVDGVTVAKADIGAVTYEFYPDSDALIEADGSGYAANIHITTK